VIERASTIRALLRGCTRMPLRLGTTGRRTAACGLSRRSPGWPPWRG